MHKKVEKIFISENLSHFDKSNKKHKKMFKYNILQYTKTVEKN